VLKPWQATALAGLLVASVTAGCGTGPATVTGIDQLTTGARPAPIRARATGALAGSVLAPQAQPAAAKPAKPNIVFVLTDDLSMNLLQYMPAVKTMQQQGTSFSNYIVSNSLCCPSRATIFTGRYPHNTKVETNSLSTGGGYKVFVRRGEDKDTFATDLQKSGYRTAFMGKYLNEYQPGSTKKPASYNPAGWNEWAMAASGYSGFGYNLNQNGKVVHHGKKAKDYLTDVISARGQDFIKRSAAKNQPFMLELSVFTPHKPYVPAPRDAKMFKGLKAPRGKAYGAKNKNAPAWLATQKLTKAQKTKMDKQFRWRAQTVQSVSKMITDVRSQLRRSGVADNTYIVFSSDNGYHMGEHSLISGKMTAFDTDVHVPLVVVGPDVPARSTISATASNIDLRSTFTDMAGATSPNTVDGHSLAPLWRGGSVAARSYALVEHNGPDLDKNDPDAGIFRSPNPPNYSALRARTWTYVEYKTGDVEYYDRTKDPLELRNVAKNLSKLRLAQLHREILAVEKCQGQADCEKAQAAL
jgi:arylsulfatase A-like enzyme